jgi:hypothetical protein
VQTELSSKTGAVDGDGRCSGVVRAAMRTGATTTMRSKMSIDCYLVDPASSHMLVSKIKPCMSQYLLLQGETANGSLNQLWFTRSYRLHGYLW